MLRTRLASSALALTACSIGSFSVAAASTPDTTPPSSDDEPATGGGDAPVDVEFQIDMILGLVPQDEMNEYYANDELERQQAIQACMNEAGFEYNIDTNNGGGFVSSPERTPEEQAEWARQWGFGMWTTMDPDASNEAYPEFNSLDEWVDPNPFVQDMSESERNAWYEQSNRCYEQTYQDDNQTDPYRNPMVQQALEDFQTWIENDPRMRDAQKTWRDCMADAGQPFADEQAMWESVYSDDDNGDLQNQFYQSEAWKPDSPDHAQWQSLVDNEIAIAVASATCGPPLNDVRQEVSESLRPRLVEAWQDVDWDLPPVTYPGEDMLFDSGFGTEPAEVPVGSGVGSGDEPVALDLSGAATTTQP